MKIYFRLFVMVVVLCALAVSCGSESSDGAGKDDTSDSKVEPGGEKLPDGLTPEQAAKVVAKVGERTITVGDVTEQINRLSPYIRRRWAAPEKRKEFLQKLIRVELLSQEAERQGLADDPEVQRTVKQVMIRLMVKNDLEKEVLPTSVEEAVLKEEYEKDFEKYHRPAQVRASHIVVATEAEAKALIKELMAKADDRKAFRDKAKGVSLDEESKGRGGDLGYFSKPEEAREDEPKVDKDVALAAWSLEKVGDMLPSSVKTDAGYHVIKLTNKKPEMNRSFESVKRLIENRLLRQLRREKMDEFVEGLKGKAKIEMFEANLATIEVEAGPGKGHSHKAPGPNVPGSTPNKKAAGADKKQ